MGWNDKYWDLLNGLYWVPSYLGLKSIPRKHWRIEDDRVSVPKSMTNENGPLYRRIRSGQDYWDFVRRQEEIFNQLFDLALALLPGETLAGIFEELLETRRGTANYVFQDSTMRAAHEWMHGENVTTPDSVLVSEDCIIAIELKFGAKTTLDQVAKYVAFLAGEIHQRQAIEHLSLLIIYPSDPEIKLEKQTSLRQGIIGKHNLGKLRESTHNQRVKALLAEEIDLVERTLDRTCISCVTWSSIANQIETQIRGLDDSPGDKTLAAVLHGLLTEIKRHPLAGLAEAKRSAK